VKKQTKAAPDRLTLNEAKKMHYMTWTFRIQI